MCTMNETYIDIKKIASIKGLKSTRAIRIAIQKGKYVAREIKVAVELAKVFNCGVNDLPLSIVLSWNEQKAVCVLLTLLYLGITNIKLGPSLPAFISPNVLNLLVEKYNIAPTTTPEQDLKEILAK